MIYFRALVSLRSQNDKHLVSFHPRPCFNFADVDQILFEFLQNARAELTVRHLASAKPDRGFNFVAALQPFARVFHPVVVVVIVRAGPKLDFLDGDRHLLLLRLVCLLLGFVLKLSEVNNSANRRIGSGSNFHQIQTLFPGGANCVSNIQDAKLLSLFADYSDLGNTDSLVNAGDRQAPVIRTLAATSKACSYASPPKLEVPGFKFQVSSSKPET
jgi:hypothetical protein